MTGTDSVSSTRQPEQAITPGRWRTADTARGGFRSTSYTTGLTGAAAIAVEPPDMEAMGVFRRFACPNFAAVLQIA